jgi:putative glycosyltransferase (TIGR04372 family)
MGETKRIVDFAFPPGTSRRVLLRLLVEPRYWIGLAGLAGLRMVRRFVDLRVGLISADRIGHFVPDVSIRFAEKALPDQSRKAIYWVEGQISNAFWFKLMKRNLTCHAIAGQIARLAPFFSDSGTWFLPSPRWTIGSRDVDGLINKTRTRLAFLPQENNLARNWLKNSGWVDGQPFVCVMVRDSRFLSTEPGQTPADYGLDNDAWAYHDYRDSDIQTFVPAMEWLADQGVFVLRMGKTMESALMSNHPNIIDYAFHPDKSDFLDIWLFAHCDTCITTGTGPDGISVAYERPVLAINFLPLADIRAYAPVVTAGKRLLHKDGNPLSLAEHFNAAFFSSKDYFDEGIGVVNLDSGEILEIVKEYWVRRRNKDNSQPTDYPLRAEFVDLLTASPLAKKNVFLHSDANLSRVWVEMLSNRRSQIGPQQSTLLDPLGT